jgi:hypothetical protein
MRGWRFVRPLARGPAHRNLRARWCCDDDAIHNPEADEFLDYLTIRPILPTGESRAILARERTLAGARLPDIICCSLFDWHFRYQRPQQMMSQFALAGHRVFITARSFSHQMARRRFWSGPSRMSSTFRLPSTGGRRFSTM